MMHGYCIPLRWPMRGVTQRQGIVVRGPAGWGEYSPFPGFSDGLEARCWSAARASASDPWPAPVRSWIPVHATIPAIGPEAAAEMILASGCTSAKVKVAEGDDEARLEAVRDTLGPGGQITVDSNGAWTVDEAVVKVKAFRRHEISLYEQPVATLEEMRTVRSRIDVPIAADESATSPQALRAVADMQAADAVVVKVQHFGGVAPALDAISEAGLPAIVSCLIETSVGLSAAVALAAALPELPFSCGLATVQLLQADLVDEPLIPIQGRLEVRRPDVSMSALSKYAAEVEAPEHLV